MEDFSLHILDVAENSIDAGAGLIEIDIVIDTIADRMTLRIKDNGRGMSRETIDKVLDPFYTTKTVRRFGLGLPFLAQATQECNGNFSIDSEEGKGTIITADFRNSHLDRKPLGDIGSTIMVLLSGHGDIDFVFAFKRDDYYYRFDTREIKKELDGTPINLPGVLGLIKDDINEALREG